MGCFSWLEDWPTGFPSLWCGSAISVRIGLWRDHLTGHLEMDSWDPLASQWSWALGQGHWNLMDRTGNFLDDLYSEVGPGDSSGRQWPQEGHPYRRQSHSPGTWAHLRWSRPLLAEGSATCSCPHRRANLANSELQKDLCLVLPGRSTVLPRYHAETANSVPVASLHDSASDFEDTWTFSHEHSRFFLPTPNWGFAGTFCRKAQTVLEHDVSCANGPQETRPWLLTKTLLCASVCL